MSDLVKLLIGCTPVYNAPEIHVLEQATAYQPGYTEAGCTRASVGLNHTTDTYVTLQINDELQLLGTGIQPGDQAAIEKHEPLGNPTARGLFYEELDLSPGIHYVQMCTIQPDDFHAAYGNPGYNRILGRMLPIDTVVNKQCDYGLIIIK